MFGALGSGGTAYFAAQSDLSTLLDELALVYPTDFNTVPLGSVDAIDVDGIHNVVTYRSGWSRITNSGSPNTIQQG